MLANRRAVEYNYPKIVKYLTQIGADPDIKNDAGWKSMDGIDGIKCPSSTSALPCVHTCPGGDCGGGEEGGLGLYVGETLYNKERVCAR